MKPMKTATRRIWNKKEGKLVPVTFKYHPCEGTTAFGRNRGKPCTSNATIQVGDHYYCGFHHPNKAKRRLSPFKLYQQRNNITPKSKTVVEGGKIIRRIKLQRSSPVAAAESAADNFASSLSSIIEKMVADAILKHRLNELSRLTSGDS